jgi:hypothetical protein
MHMVSAPHHLFMHYHLITSIEKTCGIRNLAIISLLRKKNIKVEPNHHIKL